MIGRPNYKETFRIGLLVRSFEGGGAERVMITLANKFLEWNYAVDFIVIKDKGVYKKDLNSRANLVVLNKKWNKFIGPIVAFSHLLFYLKKRKPDCLLSTPKRTNIIALVAKLIFFRKLNLTIREASTFDWVHSEPGFKTNLLLTSMRILYPHSIRILANSQITKQDLVSYLGLDTAMISVIYNPLDLNLIKKEAGGTARHSKKTVVGCGRLFRNKNFRDLIACFPNVLAHYPDAELIILGKGPEKERLQDQIDSLHLTKSVHLVGFVRNPYAFFSQANVFVQTSLWEGFGYVLVEAMACGTPVIAYDSKGAMREILENGKYGTLVPVGNLHTLSQAIISQFKSPTSHLLLEEAVKRFDSNNIARKYLNVIKKGSL